LFICRKKSRRPLSDADGRALKLCPHLIIIPGHHRLYREASRQVMNIIHDVTPLVEQISIDEAFLDVTDLPGAGEQIARDLQTKILQEFNLPCSFGIAANKLVAKIATDVGKSNAKGKGKPPSAIQVVPPGEESAFLAPLPIESLWGVDRKPHQYSWIWESERLVICLNYLSPR